jgi:hypothetical protein
MRVSSNTGAGTRHFVAEGRLEGREDRDRGENYRVTILPRAKLQAERNHAQAERLHNGENSLIL